MYDYILKYLIIDIITFLFPLKRKCFSFSWSVSKFQIIPGNRYPKNIQNNPRKDSRGSNTTILGKVFFSIRNLFSLTFWSFSFNTSVSNRCQKSVKKWAKLLGKNKSGTLQKSRDTMYGYQLKIRWWSIVYW